MRIVYYWTDGICINCMLQIIKYWSIGWLQLYILVSAHWWKISGFLVQWHRCSTTSEDKYLRVVCIIITLGSSRPQLGTAFTDHSSRCFFLYLRLQWQSSMSGRLWRKQCLCFEQGQLKRNSSPLPPETIAGAGNYIKRYYGKLSGPHFRIVT